MTSENNPRSSIGELEDRFFRELLALKGTSVLIVTESDQLNLFGQTFRPVFCGEIIDVQPGHLTLFPVNIKIINAPQFNFPTPLSIPFEKIAHFTPDFDCNERIPLT
ncbi:hypothetical protein [Cytobacillus gottheilii]|uniref:hypothetical protein n=1 Tax=Cytobacillus gottheilii TaxID=859144 RepID=UPI0009B996A2|nr:hypothetical protein [Cytobacillus gottheilii]